MRTRCQAGNEQFPDAAAAAITHGMTASIPVIEIPGHAHPHGVGSPDGKTHPGNAIHGERMRAEHAPKLPMAAFGEQVQIQFAQLGRERVGIRPGMLDAVAVTPAEYGMGGQRIGRPPSKCKWR